MRMRYAVCGMRMTWFHIYVYPCVCTLFSCLSERKHPTLTSYSRISQLPPSDFVPFAAWIATWSDSVCRVRSQSQPHDKSHAVSGHMESPSSVYMLFDFCRITHNACRLRLPRIWNPSFRSMHAGCSGWRYSCRHSAMSLIAMIRSKALRGFERISTVTIMCLLYSVNVYIIQRCDRTKVLNTGVVREVY